MGESERLPSEKGDNLLADRKEAGKLPADIFQEAVHEAFGAKDADKLVRAGDRLPNASMANLNFASNPAFTPGLIKDSISTIAVGASAAAVLETTALKSAKELAFVHKPGLVFDDLGSLNHSGYGKATDVMNWRAGFVQGYKDLRAAQHSVVAAETGLAATNVELHSVAQTYKTPFAELPGVSPALARDRHLFFNGSAVSKIGYLNNSARDFIGTAEELGTGKKLFLEGSREAGVLNALESGRQLQINSGMQLRESTASYMSNLRKLSTAESRLANASYFEAGLKGFGKGALTSAASLGAAYAVDSMMGNQSSLESTPRALLDGVAVPAAILSELPTPYKVGLAGSAFLASRALGYIDSRNISLSPGEGRVLNPISNSEFSAMLQKHLKQQK